MFVLKAFYLEEPNRLPSLTQINLSVRLSVRLSIYLSVCSYMPAD